MLEKLTDNAKRLLRPNIFSNYTEHAPLRR